MYGGPIRPLMEYEPERGQISGSGFEAVKKRDMRN
jgi:hypothetical protein